MTTMPEVYLRNIFNFCTGYVYKSSIKQLKLALYKQNKNCLYVFNLRVTQCCLTPNENISAELCQGTWWWRWLMRWWWSLLLTRLNRLDWILKCQLSETTVHRKIRPPTFTQAYYPDSDPTSLYSTRTQVCYPDSEPTRLYSTLLSGESTNTNI